MIKAFKVGDNVLRYGAGQSLWKYKIISKKGWWIFSEYIIESRDQSREYFLQAKWSELFPNPKDVQ